VVRNGERQWVSRNLDYTPVRVAQLHRMLDFRFTLEKEQRVAKITEETLGATHVNCVKTEMQNGVVVVSTQFCVDKSTGLPLRKLHLVLGGLNERLEYQDYFASGAEQFPRQIRLFENDKLAVELWLDSLSTEPQDESSFAALPNAVVWPVCENMKHPVRIHTPDPEYADTDRKNRVQGTVVLQMVVDTQGKPANIAVARSLSPGLDKEAQKTVSGWRFRPAMCGDTPVPTEMNIEVTFRLYN